MQRSLLQEMFNSITQRDGALRRRAMPSTPLEHGGLLAACRDLLASDGEASSIALARHALDIYRRLDDTEKRRFFEGLAVEFTADAAAIDDAYRAYRETRDNHALQALFEACEPRRQELLRRLNLAPGGTLDLVHMRRDLLDLRKQHPELGAVDADFAHLLGSWFNRGFLVLQRIDWHSPAAILENIINYEAVHAIDDWDDLRRRLDPADRRCFAFFHPAIGDEPLIFVEVALHKGLPDRVQPILAHPRRDVERAEDADTAAFFGISNCQRGLRGVSFGNFLLKQVVQDLSHELPNLKNFVTLSPVPGFAAWLTEQRQQPDSGLDNETRRQLEALDQPGWQKDERQAEKLRELVTTLAAQYLRSAKDDSGQPLNPVARFHLGNGARLHRINWLGDTSAKGMRESHGLMVNYLYVLDEIERNHERFVVQGTIACSNEVRDLDKRARKLLKGGSAR